MQSSNSGGFMKATKLISMFVIFVLALTAIQCKKSESTEADPKDLVGAWTANKDVDGTKMDFTSLENPANTVKMFLFNASIDIVLNSDNTYTLTLVVPPLDIDEVEEGMATFSGNKITLTADDYPDEAITFEWSLNGSLLSLTTNDAEFDFNFDDEDDPAKLDIILRKLN
jgi:hypothetical protein